MGLRPLGDAWKRRISEIVGEEVVHASGNGGSEFLFTTASHKHGTFSRFAWYWSRHGKPELAENIWRWDLDSTGKSGEECEARLWSCRTLFGEGGVLRDREVDTASDS